MAHGMRLCDNMDLVIPREQRRLYAAQEAEAKGLGDTTLLRRCGPGRSRHTTRWVRSRSMFTVTSRRGRAPAARSTRLPDGSATRRLIGCGCYADNLSAAVSLTGWGEPIMKLVLGKWAVDRVAQGSEPQQAASDAIAYLYDRLGGYGGVILLGPDGRIGLAHNTPRMAWGLATRECKTLGVTRNA